MSELSYGTNLQRVLAVQDDSSHWFVIPYNKAPEFFADLENEEIIDSGEFDNKWGQYRTGGDLNLVALYAEI